MQRDESDLCRGRSRVERVEVRGGRERQASGRGWMVVVVELRRPLVGGVRGVLDNIFKTQLHLCKACVAR